VRRKHPFHEPNQPIRIVDSKGAIVDEIKVVESPEKLAERVNAYLVKRLGL